MRQGRGRSSPGGPSAADHERLSSEMRSRTGLAVVSATAPHFGGFAPVGKAQRARYHREGHEHHPYNGWNACRRPHRRGVRSVSQAPSAARNRHVGRGVYPAYTAGELEDGDVAVDELVGKLRIGQNGHKSCRVEFAQASPIVSERCPEQGRSATWRLSVTPIAAIPTPLRWSGSSMGMTPPLSWMARRRPLRARGDRGR